MNDPPEATPSLVELLLLQREAWERGQTLLVEELLHHHPSFPPSEDDLLDLIYNEIVLREERGQTPRLEDFQARFPHLAEPLSIQFEVDHALNEEGGSLPEARLFPSTLLTVSSTENADGQPLLPGCEILGELGRGAMGIVYRAWQVALNRQVALKVLHPGVPLARVRTEAEAVARLQHPHIVQLFEVKEHAGRTALVLEYVEGGNLAQKIDGKPQSPREAAELVEVLARATAYAHAKGVVHRDLKPGNVLLAAAPDAPLAVCTPKISDFGLAKLLTGGAGLTHATDILGTPSYMAPEQAGGETVGPAVDVYALGAILYELLTGHPPFLSENLLDTLSQVKHQDPVPPRRLQPPIPGDLETITLKCLHKAPGGRYLSALDLANDLRAFLDGRPIAARPSGPLERLVKWMRRRPAAAALIGVTVLAAAILAAVGLHFTQQVRQQRDLAEARAGQLQVQLDRTRQLLFTTQLLRVGAVWESDPIQGLQLLEDSTLCPPDLRDFTWGVFHARCQRYTFDLSGHTRKVSALAYRPDGEVLASGGHDGLIKFWNPARGQLLASLHEHTSRVLALAWSPNSQFLASGGSDGTILLHEGQTVRGRWSEAGRVTGLVFLDDGRTLAANAGHPGQPGAVTMREVSSGRVVARLPEPTLSGSGLIASPDGLTLACAGPDQEVWLWETRTHKLRHRLRGHAKPVTALAFSPAGLTLASGDSDRSLRWWNIENGESQGILDSETGSIGALAWSRDGRTLAVAGDNPLAPFRLEATGSIVLLDVLQRKPREVLRGHREPVGALVFSPEGQTLASAGGDKSIKLWNIVDKPTRIDLDRHTGGLASAALSADGNTLAWVSRPEDEGKGRKRDDRGLEITVYDLARGQVRARLAGQRRPILCLAVSADGNTVASAAGGAEDAVELKLHDVASGREVRSLPGHTAPVQALAFSPDSRTLASGGWDRTLRLWDVASGTLRKVPGLEQPLHSRITCLAFSPDGRLLASGGGQVGESGEVWLLDPATGTRWRPLVVPAPVTCLAFDPSGHHLGVGAQDGVVQLHEIGSEEEPRRISSGMQPVHCLALHPDGRTLALGGPGALVRLRDLQLGQERATLPGHAGGVCFLAFCRQGRLLISVDRRRRACLWHAVIPGSGE